MPQLFPQVRNKTNLGAKFTQTLYLPIAVEGHALAAGTGIAGTVYKVESPSQADDLFAPTSTLAILVKTLLSRGVNPVLAVASVKAVGAPTLVERQAAWATLQAREDVRLRMTDAVTQADLVALADSCEWAELAQNMQVGIGGMASGVTKANIIAAATAMASTRGVLVGPGVLDANGVLLSGNLAAAYVAAEVAKNNDIADDLDTLELSGLTGIEKDGSGNPLFQIRTDGGVLTNDYEDVLIGGGSPVMQSPNGGVAISHLRTTFITNGTYDALMTRLIVDQLFVDVRDYCKNAKFLRRGNDEENRDDLRAGVEALLAERRAWIKPKPQPDGTLGYLVAVTPTVDNRGVIVTYEGTVVRGIQTIDVSPSLEIPV